MSASSFVQAIIERLGALKPDTAREVFSIMELNPEKVRINPPAVGVIVESERARFTEASSDLLIQGVETLFSIRSIVSGFDWRNAPGALDLVCGLRDAARNLIWGWTPGHSKYPMYFAGGSYVITDDNKFIIWADTFISSRDHVATPGGA